MHVAGVPPPPQDDILDDPNAQDHAPSAPPLEKMDAVPGYNNVGFSAGEKYVTVCAIESF